MSMLAERRFKVRYTLNPRKEFYTKEPDGIGLKMLKKMGWDHGKGLGVNENGIVDPVRVSVKNNSEGMGFLDETGNNWTKHEDNFTDLLRNLHEANDVPTDKDSKSIEKLESLEAKSKQTRKRVHYGKFTKGKDLSCRSAKDLANIFGRKSLSTVNVSKISNASEVSKTSDLEKFPSGGHSITEYFKKKIGNLKIFGGGSDVYERKTTEIDQESDSDTFSRAGFGMSSFLSTKRKLSDSENDSTREKKSKKRKLQNETAGIDNPNFIEIGGNQNSPQLLAQEEEEESFAAEPTKINKKKSKKCKNSSSFCIDNPAFDGNFFKENIKNNTDDDEEISQQLDDGETVVSIHKKYKKKKNLHHHQESEKSEKSKESQHVKKKKKKRNSSQFCIDNPTFDDLFNNKELKNDEISDNDNKKETTKKKTKEIVDSSETKSVEIHDTPTTTMTTPKKKKNKSKHAPFCIDNPAFVDPLQKTVDTPQTEKYANNDLEGTFNDLEESLPNSTEAFTSSSQEEKCEKKKKKKKKRKHENVTTENVSLSLNDTSEQHVADECSTENESKVKKQKKRKKQKNAGIDNPVFRHNSPISQEKSDTSSSSTVINSSSSCDDEGFVNEHHAHAACHPLSKGKLDKGGETVQRKTLNEQQQKSSKGNKNIAAAVVLTSPKFTIIEDLLINVSSSDVVVAPSISTPSTGKVHHRREKKKSVRIDEDRNEEYIIPNDGGSVLEEETHDAALATDPTVMVMPTTTIDNGDLILNCCGVSNGAFDIQADDDRSYYDRRMENRKQSKRAKMRNVGRTNDAFTDIHEQVEEAVRQLDSYEAQVENDFNEKKMRNKNNGSNNDNKDDDNNNIKKKYVGETDGRTVDEHVRVPEGIRLSFKRANLTGTMQRHDFQAVAHSKKSYKHLIKGDVVLEFDSTNLDSIGGYAHSIINK